MNTEKLTTYRGELRYQEPMSRHTSWRAGGDAKVYYKPADLDDLCSYLAGVPLQEQVMFLGLGSNMLVRDRGVNATVISLQGVLEKMRLLDKEVLYAQAGVTCAKFARFAAQHCLAGGEFLAGIPGTVGGALAMNAGAFGGETWNYVTQVETINRLGEVHKREPSEFKIAYRSVSGLNQEWFIGASFKFTISMESEIKASIKALLEKRNHTQPTGMHSCGSVFRNPDGDYAARLVESAGLKGYRIGGAYVSDKHANFIINDNNATASDIENLIMHIQYVVENKFGVKLQKEVRIIGEENDP